MQTKSKKDGRLASRGDDDAKQQRDIQQQKLMLVMDHPSYPERKLDLLKFLLRRLSIDSKEYWEHVYCYRGRTALPTRKKERALALHDAWADACQRIEANQPCVIVGLGRLACECLTGASILSTKASADWDTEKWGRVWITYSPEAALCDPNLIVPIAGTIELAAEYAGIKTKRVDVPMFQWREFELGSRA